MNKEKIAIATVYVSEYPGDNLATKTHLELRDIIQYVFFADELLEEDEVVNELQLIIRVTNLAEIICEQYQVPVRVVIRWNNLRRLFAL